jgi:predicted ATPase
LEKELGVLPSAETTALYERIRAAGDAPKHNLPAPGAPFLGRADELRAIVSRLLDPHCRLLTVIGLGGSGKTRLALAAGEQLAGAFLNGVWFVPLAGVAAAGQLPFALADALRFDVSGSDAGRQLLGYLAEKEALLILDNFEHLAADDTGAQLLAAILERAPDVKLLVTSRERLNLQREWLHELQPLSSDDAAAVFRYYAGRIAPDEAIAGEPALPAIRRICASVGGLPLALALAAGWTRVMTCEDIAAALERDMALLATSTRDAPERHRSMQVVFDHSWRLLPLEEARVLAALAVFRSDFTGEAARAVAGASPAILSTLLDKSWLQRAPNHRFELHELVRHYAWGKLAQPESVLARHCEYFAALQAAREPLARTARQLEVFTEMRAEAEDIRLMWQTAVRGGRADVLGKALHSMFWMIDVTGRHEEGVHLFGEAADALKGRPGLESVRGRLLARQGALARLVSHYDLAEALLTEAEALSRAAGDVANQAYATRLLGFFPMVRGEAEAGLARMNESLRLYRAVNDPPRVADALISVGIAESRLGRFERAAQLHQEAADILREAGDEMGLAVAYDNLGDTARYAGDLAGALTHYRAAADVQRRYDDRRDLALSLNNIAGLLIELKQWDAALRAAQESADLFRDRGSRDGLMQALHSMAGALLGQGEVEQALRYFNEAVSIGMQLNADADLLAVLMLGARFLQARGQIADAAQWLVSINRNPAASAFTVKGAEEALQALPSEAVTRVEESGEVWTTHQMAEAMRRAALRV